MSSSSRVQCAATGLAIAVCCLMLGASAAATATAAPVQRRVLSRYDPATTSSSINDTFTAAASSVATSASAVLSNVAAQLIEPVHLKPIIQWNSNNQGCAQSEKLQTVLSSLANAWAAAFQVALDFKSDSWAFANAMELVAHAKLYNLLKVALPVKSSAGFGAGFGFTLECSGDVIASWGMGFGGGLATQNATSGPTGGYGGGGGGQTTSVGSGQPLDFGGGAGCGAALQQCGASADKGSLFAEEVLWAEAMAHLATNNKCMSEVQIYVEGGGGGGISTAAGAVAPRCAWGAGFHFQDTVIVLHRHPAPPSSSAQDVNATSSDHMPRRRASSSSNSSSSNGNGGSGISGRVAQQCNDQCVSKGSDYNGCFCPCFKRGTIAGGAPWGKQIQCYKS